MQSESNSNYGALDDFKLIESLSKFASKLIKTCNLLDKITLFVQLLACLFDSNRHRNSHTDHGVVTCADKSHHLYINEPCKEAFPINILDQSHRSDVLSATLYNKRHQKSIIFLSSTYNVLVNFLSSIINFILNFYLI